MADRSTLQREPGLRADRTTPTGWLAFEGDFAWVFGNDQPGWTGRFANADEVHIEQTDTFGTAKLIRARAYLRGPQEALPVGWKWQAYGGTTVEDRWVFDLEPGSARDMGELLFSTRDYPGTIKFGLRVVGPVLQSEELEIPTFYLDDITLDDAPPLLLIANRNPIDGEVGASRNATIQFDVIETGTGEVDLGNTTIYVNGVLAFSFLTDEPGYTTAYYNVAAGHWHFGVTVPYTFDSEAEVEVRVITTDQAATTTIDETWSFIVEDYAPPRVISAVALNHKVVRVTWDEELLAVDAAGENDALNPANWSFDFLTALAVPVTAVSVDQFAPSVFDITTNIELTQGATYRVTAANIADTDDNIVIAPYDNAEFVAYECRVERTFDLWKMLPRLNRDEDTTRDLFKFISVLQEPIDLLLCDIDRWTDILDVDRAAERYLDQMLITLGNPFEFDLDVVQKRKLVRVLVEIYQLKGTAVGLINAIRFFLGIESTIEAWSADGWELGVDELGVDSILGPGTLRERYSFIVVVPDFLTAAQRTTIVALAEYMKPAHTHLAAIVEPTIPDVIDHLELGLSELADEWILH